MTVTITNTLVYSMPVTVYLVELPSGNTAMVTAQASFGQLMLWLVMLALLLVQIVRLGKSWMTQ